MPPAHFLVICALIKLHLLALLASGRHMHKLSRPLSLLTELSRQLGWLNKAEWAKQFRKWPSLFETTITICFYVYVGNGCAMLIQKANGIFVLIWIEMVLCNQLTVNCSFLGVQWHMGSQKLFRLINWTVYFANIFCYHHGHQCSNMSFNSADNAFCFTGKHALPVCHSSVCSISSSTLIPSYVLIGLRQAETLLQ